MNKTTAVWICVCIVFVPAFIALIVISVKSYRRVIDPYENCILVSNLPAFVNCLDLRSCNPIIQEENIVAASKNTLPGGRTQDLSFYLNCEAIYYCGTGLLCKSNRNDLEDTFRSRSRTIIIERPGYSPIYPMFHHYPTGGLFGWSAGKFAKKVIKAGALIGGGALIGHKLAKNKYKGLDYSNKKVSGLGKNSDGAKGYGFKSYVYGGSSKTGSNSYSGGSKSGGASYRGGRGSSWGGRRG